MQPLWLPMRYAPREFFIDNILVRIHFIIVMIRWTGLAPWEFLYAALPQVVPGSGVGEWEGASLRRREVESQFLAAFHATEIVGTSGYYLFVPPLLQASGDLPLARSFAISWSRIQK